MNRLALPCLCAAMIALSSACVNPGSEEQSGSVPSVGLLVEETVTATATATSTPTATRTPTRRPRPPRPGLQPPRPTIKGRIGPGASPCPGTITLYSNYNVVLLDTTGITTCNTTGATVLLQAVPTDSVANFEFGTAVAGATPTGTLTPTPVPEYCIKVTLNGVVLATSSEFQPGTILTVTHTLTAPLCISP